MTPFKGLSTLLWWRGGWGWGSKMGENHVIYRLPRFLRRWSRIRSYFSFRTSRKPSTRLLAGEKRSKMGEIEKIIWYIVCLCLDGGEFKSDVFFKHFTFFMCPAPFQWYDGRGVDQKPKKWKIIWYIVCLGLNGGQFEFEVIFNMWHFLRPLHPFNEARGGKIEKSRCLSPMPFWWHRIEISV